MVQVTWCSRCTAGGNRKERAFIDSLNFSFQLVLHEDSTSWLDCNRMQLCGEHIGLRHLVSSAKRNELEWFREDDRSFIYMRNRRGLSKLPGGHRR